MSFLKSKFSKGFAIASGISLLGLYSTGNLDDAYYLLGGFFRGLRCATAGGQIFYKYIRVIYLIIIGRDK
jgi:hypothetical protein